MLKTEEINKYIEDKRKIQQCLLEYLEDGEKSENNYKNLTQLLEDSIKNMKDHYELKEILFLITKIANNHHQSQDFNDKIIQIIKFLQKDIKNSFINSEIYQIFESNKPIILFLFQQEVIKVDQIIFDRMIDKQFFLPEVKAFNSDIKDEIPENFEQKRQICQNDNYICELIRKDLIDNFITHFTQTNISPSDKIKPSIYETNPYLIKCSNETRYIEYAAFFGSIQIFNYLLTQGVELTSSIWPYAIHGQNHEIIKKLEDNKVKPENSSYLKIFKLALKCHHNKIAFYIRDKLLSEIENKSILEARFEDTLVDYGFRYYNFNAIPAEYNHQFDFFYFCLYDYYSLFSLLIDTKKIDVEAKVIQTLNFNQIKI